MPRPQATWLAVLITASLAACAPHVEGNGVFAEQTIKNLGAFQQVEIGLGIEATVTVQAGPAEVILSGDENVLSHIRVTVAGGVLEATTTDLHSGFTTVHPLRLRISVAQLVGAAASDQARVTVFGAEADDFAVAASDGSEVTLSGGGGASLAVALAGRSTLSAFLYPVASATVAISDGSTAQLHSTGDVSGLVSGGPTGSSHVEIEGGGACTAVLTGGSLCGPPSH